MTYGNTSVFGSVSQAPALVRAGFLRQVYGLFFISILVTIVVGVITAGMGPVMMKFQMPLLIAFIVLAIAMAFARRTTGLNIALFYLFSAVEGAIAGPMLMLINLTAPGVPMMAAVITGGIFGGLSLYALVSGKDFSFLGGFLFMGLIAVMIGGLVLMFLHVAALYTLYTVGGALIFSGYILYDTSMIMRKLAPEQAIIGAISLYLDLVNLFWFILQILMEFSGNSRRN